MTKILDTAAPCTPYLSRLKGAGVETVIRYFASPPYPGQWDKRVHPAEARAIAAAGLKLGNVFEDLGGTRNYSDINPAHGVAHANICLNWAPTVGTPDNTIIWFAVDTDARGAQLTSNIVPYFKAIKDRFAGKYRPGVYGCGAACAAALDAGVADAAWLSNAKGWNGYYPFFNSRRWSLLQYLPTYIGGMSVDPDEANGDYGAFVPFGGAAPVEPPKPADPNAKPMIGHGSTGAAVAELQKQLGIPDDGIFGPQTEAALRNFQRTHGLTADGWCGPLTWAALK